MSAEEVLESVAGLLRAAGVPLGDAARYFAEHDLTPTASNEGPALVPTLAEYVNEILPALTQGTRRGWATHYRRLIDGTAPICDCTCPECLDTTIGCACRCSACVASRIQIPTRGGMPVARGMLTRSGIEQYLTVAQRFATKKAISDNARRASRGLSPKPEEGHGARTLALDAVRHLLNRAVDDEYLERSAAATIRLNTPDNATRRGLTEDELEEVFAAAASGGDDPELDVLLVWFHAETGCRREGAINLRCGHLLHSAQMLRVSEKGGKVADQPVSAELIEALQAHAITRRGPSCNPTSALYDVGRPVLYTRRRTDGAPRALTGRRYDTLFKRLQLSLPWACEMRFTAHHLRHTAGAVIERIAGTQVARAFLRHAESTTTDRYTDASLEEVAAAVAIMTGSPHPLAPDTPAD